MSKTFSAVQAVKDISRDLFRNMPKERSIADKRRKPPKHRKQQWED